MIPRGEYNEDGEMVFPFTCKVCGSENKGFNPGSNICPICDWGQDGVQESSPNLRGGMNYISFNEAKENYTKCGNVATQEVLREMRLFKRGIINKAEY